MGHLPFSKPVFLKLHATGNFQARTLQDAVEYLKHLWPGERSAHYRRAKALCQGAVEGTADPETAKAALIDAAERAGVLANGRGLDGVTTDTSYVLWGSHGQEVADDLDVTDSDMVGYYRARDIVDDASLSPSRKRALLAYWASDIHAVAGSPSLRCARGVTVSIDSIFAALASLDEEVDQAAMVDKGAAAGRSW